MDRHTEQLVGALFTVLKTQGHAEARRQLMDEYRSHSSQDHDALIDALVADLVTVLHQHLTPREEVDVLTATVEYLVNRFVSIIEVAPVAIVVVDAEGSVQLWNDGAERIFGWTESEMLTESYSDVLADPAGADLPISRLADGHRLTGIETQHHHRDGSVLDVRVWAAPLHNHDETFTGATFVVSDITARKQREQRLTVLNRVLRHNIRNDITVVRGHLDLLADAVSEDNDHVEAIEAKLQSIAELSETARHIEQLQSDDREEGLTRVELSTVLGDHLDRLRLDWPDAAVESSIPDQITVLAHELLPYALDNLLENAVEHNDSDVPCVRVAVRVPDDRPERVTIAVGDDGPGLPDAEREVLTRETETAMTHSTGMGLWLTRWIVRSSGGTLAVEESRFGGTRVVVELQRPTRADADSPS